MFILFRAKQDSGDGAVLLDMGKHLIESVIKSLSVGPEEGAGSEQVAAVSKLPYQEASIAPLVPPSPRATQQLAVEVMIPEIKVSSPPQGAMSDHGISSPDYEMWRSSTAGGCHLSLEQRSSLISQQDRERDTTKAGSGRTLRLYQVS